MRGASISLGRSNLYPWMVNFSPGSGTGVSIPALTNSRV